MPQPDSQFASRGGGKLSAALKSFHIDPTGLICADLGCSTGGFTDCLLQRGAAHVYAVDTAYGQLAWKLRQDDRVTVMERTNALHAEPLEPVDLVTIDLGWTKQDKAIPAALRWLKPEGRIITLIKPHYELGKADPTDQEAEQVTKQVISGLPKLGVTVTDFIRSPILGGKGGNAEYLALLKQTAAG